MERSGGKKESLPKKVFKWAFMGALVLGAAHLLVSGGTAVSGELHKVALPKPL